jgi:RNA polymerase sigma factor (sigma-70 family)
MPAPESDARSADAPAGSGEAAPPTTRTAQGAELAARFWDRLRVVAARRTGDAAAANEIARETLRRVADAMRSGQLERPAALPALVFQTVRPVCAERQRVAPLEPSAGAPSETRRGDQGRRRVAIETLRSLIADERRRDVGQAFRSLRDGDQKVLRLVYLDRLNVDQIAARLGSTAGAVRVRKHRALRRLADYVAPRPRGTATARGGR